MFAYIYIEMIYDVCTDLALKWFIYFNVIHCRCVILTCALETVVRLLHGWSPTSGATVQRRRIDAVPRSLLADRRSTGATAFRPGTPGAPATVNYINVRKKMLYRLARAIE